MRSAMSEDPQLGDFLDYMEKLNYERLGVLKGTGTDTDDDFDLGRMMQLLQRLGNPHIQFKHHQMKPITREEFLHIQLQKLYNGPKPGRVGTRRDVSKEGLLALEIEGNSRPPPLLSLCTCLYLLELVGVQLEAGPLMNRMLEESFLVPVDQKLERGILKFLDFNGRFGTSVCLKVRPEIVLPTEVSIAGGKSHVTSASTLKDVWIRTASDLGIDFFGY